MQPSQSPSEFLSTLRQLDIPSRASHILDRIRLELAATLEVQLAALRPDTKIPKVRYGDNMVAVTGQPLEALRAAIRRALGLHVYPKELALFDDLRGLAFYLAREIDVPPVSAEERVASESGRDWPCPWNAGLHSTKVRRPVFILSSPRAGSTLLRVMLHGHPDLFAPPELNLLPFGTMGLRARWFRQRGCPWMGTGLLATVMALEGVNEDDARTRVGSWEQAETPVVEVYRWLQDRAEHKRIVDKSPLYSLYRGSLLPVIDCCPGARFIHLVRHPHAVIESIVRMRFHRLYGDDWPAYSASPWKYAENCWRQCNQNISALLRLVPADQQLTIRFEDLANDPRAVSSEICTLLGIELHRGILTPYDGDRMTHQDNQPTLGDPNFLEHQCIDAQRATADVNLPSSFKLQASSKQVAAELGYNVE